MAAAAIGVATAAGAQQNQPSGGTVETKTNGRPVSLPEDIVVTAKRVPGSAIADVEPLAVLDSAAIQAMAATSFNDLLARLRPLTTSASGSDTVDLLNGRRVSGPEELQNLPPEAIERVEVLPEREAVRFGFPPTARVTNFITKRRYRSTATQELAGTTTEGGGGTNYTEAVSTRIDGNRRTSLSVSYFRQDPILESQRDIVPDPAGGDGGASMTSSTGRFRTIQQSTDTVVANGTLAGPVGRKLSGSLNVRMEAARNSGLDGLMYVTPVSLNDGSGPGSTPTPIDGLPDPVLRQRGTRLDLHVGGTITGGFGPWTWNLITAADRLRNEADSAQAEGTERSASTTQTLVGNVVASGPLLHLPAGTVVVTASAGQSHLSSDVRDQGPMVDASFVNQAVTTASVNVDLPIASAGRGLLTSVGDLSVNGMVGLTAVSAFPALLDSSVGASWHPAKAIQITASIRDTTTPPSAALLAAPTVLSPNTPFFDFVTGRSGDVTVTTGGDPRLRPERRRVATVGAEVRPLRGKEFRLGVDYIDTRIVDQSATLGSATIDFESAFPDHFLRNQAGDLIDVDLRPVNVAQERERQIRMTASLSTSLKRTVPVQTGSGEAPAAPKSPPTLSGFVTATIRRSDQLMLSSGQPVLNLLDGATLSGTGGRPRWQLEEDMSLSSGAVSLDLYGRLQGGTRIRSDIPTSDLRFSGRTWFVLSGSLDVGRLARGQWVRKLSVQATVENLLDDRITVADRNGATPNRFQAAYLDPLGRSIRLGLRKLF